MTLYNVIDSIKILALKHPNVNSAEEGDIYSILNANQEQKYAKIVLTQDTHTEDEVFDNYNLNIFYVDRLFSDIETNRLDIQSTAKNVLSNIIRAFCEEFDAECNSINYHTFTERFIDECAGAYATITISIPKSINCVEKYWDESWATPLITVRNQNKTVQFTANGTYTVTYDATNYSGLGKVEVEVNVPDLNGSYDDGYSEGKEDGIQEGYADGKADGIEEGYSQGKTDGFNEGKLEGYIEGKEKGISEQKAKLEGITITGNGIYIKEDGYNSVEVALPIQNDKVADIRLNGSYVIEPDDNYDAFDKLVLNVEAKAKTAIPNGVSFAGSTFTEFPVENYDWKAVRDTTFMFANCPNLNTEPIIDALKDGTIPTRCTAFMFYGSKVKKIEGIDFTQYHSCLRMFENISDLDEIKNCKLPYYDDNSVYEFISCSNKYFKLIDCDISNIKDYKFLQDKILYWYFGRFQNVDNLENLPYISSVSKRVFVMECDKPSTLKTDGSSHIWYDATKYSGWDEFGLSHPYGFTYNVISKDKLDVDIRIKQRDTQTNFSFEQIIPYNEEKGCYYIDYPYYMEFDVYINGVKKDVLRSKFNIDVYYPSNEVGVYEGLDLKYLFCYEFNNVDFTLNENGLFVLKTSNTGGIQRFNTPTDVVKITTVRNDSSGSKWLYITINGERNLYTIKQNSETEFIIDTSNCEYMDVEMYITSNLDKTYIKSIEIL